MISLIILSIFAGIKTWGIATIISAILGLGIVKKWAILVDIAAKFISKWSGKIYLEIQEHSSLLLDIQNTTQKIDDAIAEDGSTDLNTLKEAIELGKTVKVKLEDIILEIKSIKK